MAGKAKGAAKTIPCFLLPFFSCSCPALSTQTFQVTASIVNGCTISGNSTGSWGQLDFGTHSSAENATVNTSFLQNTAITLACTPGTTLSMSINGGSNYSTTRNLTMAGNTTPIPYRIYSNASYSAASEILVNQNVVLTYSNANNITLPVYGRLQLNGAYRAGSYSDTLTVTLSW